MKIGDQSVVFSELSSSYDRFYGWYHKEEKTNVSVHLSFEAGQISKNRYFAGFSFIEVSDHLFIRLKMYFCKGFCVEVDF